MLSTTRAAVAALLEADPTVDKDAARSALAALDGRARGPRLVRRGEVARMLGVCPQTVTQYAREGRLRQVFSGAGRSRSTGYLESDVLAFLEESRGKPAAAGTGRNGDRGD